MQLAGSGNGTAPCHRPITEHAGRARRQLPSNDSRGAARGKMGGGLVTLGVEAVVVAVVVVVVVVVVQEEERGGRGYHETEACSGT